MCVCVCVCVAFVDLTPVLFKESSLIASKSKDILESKFLISELSSQCNKDSCCNHIAGGVNIYLDGFVSLLVPEFFL